MLYAAALHRPRNRRSPTTLPAASNLYPDVAEVRRAVHCRVGVGLGEVQQGGVAGLAADLGGQLGETAGNRVTGVAQDAEPGARNRAQDVGLAVRSVRAALGEQVVLPVAQEGEVVIGHPLQQRARLVPLGRRGRHGLGQRAGEVQGRLVHGRPVLVGGPHIGQHADQISSQLLEQFGLGLPVDLDMDERLRPSALDRSARWPDRGHVAAVIAPHQEHRVDHEVQPVALPAEQHADRVHQERHVVGDDLHGGVTGLPVVLLEHRGVDADVRRTGFAVATKLPVRQGHPEQVDLAAVDDVVRQGAPVVLPQEALEPGGLQLRQPAAALAKRLDGPVDQIGFGLLQRRRHPWSSHLRRLDCPGSNRGVPPSDSTAPPPTVVSGRRRLRIGRRYAWAQAKRGQAP